MRAPREEGKREGRQDPTGRGTATGTSRLFTAGGGAPRQGDPNSAEEDEAGEGTEGQAALGRASSPLCRSLPDPRTCQATGTAASRAKAPASTGGQRRCTRGGGALPAADWGPAPGPGRPPRTGRSGAAAFGHCTAVPVLGCSSREESYPSLASQPSSRAKRGRGGRQLHRGGGQGQQRHAPGHVPRPPKVPRKGGGASRAPSARQRGGSSGWAAGRSREEAACPGDEDGGGEEGGGGSREEASLRPAETNAAPSCGGQATALHGPAPRPGAVGKP